MFDWMTETKYEDAKRDARIKLKERLNEARAKLRGYDLRIEENMTDYQRLEEERKKVDELVDALDDEWERMK